MKHFKIKIMRRFFLCPKLIYDTRREGVRLRLVCFALSLFSFTRAARGWLAARGQTYLLRFDSIAGILLSVLEFLLSRI